LVSAVYLALLLDVSIKVAKIILAERRYGNRYTKVKKPRYARRIKRRGR